MASGWLKLEKLVSDGGTLSVEGVSEEVLMSCCGLTYFFDTAHDMWFAGGSIAEGVPKTLGRCKTFFLVFLLSSNFFFSFLTSVYE